MRWHHWIAWRIFGRKIVRIQKNREKVLVPGWEAPPVWVTRIAHWSPSSLESVNVGDETVWLDLVDGEHLETIAAAQPPIWRGRKARENACLARDLLGLNSTQHSSIPPHWVGPPPVERAKRPVPPPIAPGRQAGFSPLELVIVALILGILATFAADGLLRYLDKAKIARVEGDAHAIVTEINAQCLGLGRCPESLDGLLTGRGDLDEWSYNSQEGDFVAPAAPQGSAGLPAAGTASGDGIGGLNPNDETVTGWWLQIGSVEVPLSPRLDIAFGWATGGGAPLRFEPLFSPATPAPGGGGGGDDGGDAEPIPDPCDNLPSGPIPVECR